MLTSPRSLLALALLTATAGAHAADLKSVGVSVSDLGNPFFLQVAKGVEKKAKEIGGPDVKVTVVANSYDLNAQVGQIDDFVANKVQMIVLVAADPKAIAPAIKRARDAGVVVVAVDVAAQGADITVMSDNVQAGEVACEFMAKKMGGKGNAVIVNGPPVSSVIDRVNGCKSVLAKYPDIKILSDNQNANGNREGGLTVMANLLTANPKIDGVFTINDPTGVGADLAAKQAKRSEFTIVSVDGAPAAEEVLKKEGSLFAASSAQNPQLMATRGVEIGYQILQGKRPEKNVELIPTPLITRDNIGEYKGWLAN